MTFSPSSSSLPSSLPSSSTSDLISILETITEAKANIKFWQTQLDGALDALAQLVETGAAEPSQTWNDYTITQRIRKSYIYPDHINEQREALKASERLSVALGEATLKTTTFWDVRSPKGND